MTDLQAQRKGYMSARHYERVQAITRKIWIKDNWLWLAIGLVMLVALTLGSYGQAQRLQQIREIETIQQMELMPIKEGK